MATGSFSKAYMLAVMFISGGRDDTRRVMDLHMRRLHNHSWLPLIGYCTFAVLASALALAIVLAGASVVFAAGAADAEAASPASFTGMVTDEYCGAKHERYPGKSASECARLCALNGAKYELIEGDKVYTLAGKDLALDKLAGRRSIVTGTLQGTVINVISVAPEH
ncbi:MAG: hypothetical protein ACRD2U_03675 [Terriglobales bacterium]